LAARGAAVSGSVGKKGTMRNAAYVNISIKFVYITILITFIRVLQGEYHVYNFKEFSIKKLQEMLYTPVFILLGVFNIRFKRGMENFKYGNKIQFIVLAVHREYNLKNSVSNPIITKLNLSPFPGSCSCHILRYKDDIYNVVQSIYYIIRSIQALLHG
jgi:hypothetical protein